MKKYLVLLLLALMLVASISVNAAEIKDVPKNHWAYQSVKKLVDKGLVSLYDDGTFRGKDQVSRYELAEIVARLLESIQGGATQASEEDIDLLRKLSLEFRDELVDLAKKDEVFQEQIKKLEQKDVIQDDRMTKLEEVDFNTADKIDKLNTRIENLSGELDKANRQIMDVNNQVSNIESDVTKIIDSILKIKSLEEEIARLKKEIAGVNNDVSNKITALEEEINRTDELLKKHDEQFASIENQISDNMTIQSLQDQQIVNRTRINALQKELNELKNQINSSITETKKETGSTDKNYLYGIALIAAIAILSSM